LSGTVSPGSRVTRGNGRLEGFLARHRARMANRLIPDELRGGTIVDIGCGSYPYFLSTVDFARRIGLDRFVSAGAPDAVEPGVAAAAPPGAGSATAVSPLGSTPARGPDGITLIRHDLATRTALPFEDGSIDVVTMLAVIEHLDRDVLRHTLAEIRRILRPGGIYVITTPAAWTDRFLRALARVGFLSAEEIEEHKEAYTHARIADLLEHAGFDRDAMRFGTFEFGMNLWAVVRR